MNERQQHPDDEQLFSLLDSYVQELHEGRRPARDALPAEGGDLLSVLDCLDVLHGLSPLTPADAAADAEIMSAATKAFSDQAGEGEQAAEASAFDADPLHRPEARPPLAPTRGDGSHADSQIFSAEHSLGDFGSYELLAEIGRGGMGVVYRARQKSLDRIVALKMILASHLASPEQVRRFQAEARASAGLVHPHIVRVFEVGQQHGQHYFTMDHVTGTNLAVRLAAGPLEEAVAIRLLTDVARAVEHLHQHGVVHRDLKPSNILLDDAGRPYVTDFGLAKMFSSDVQATATGLIAGTPSYMSPEQAAGRNHDVGPASDIYSLGAILYELLTGRPPFREENALETLLQVMEREPAWPRERNPKVPRALELICMKCLQKPINERYATAGELADELERFLAGEVVSAQPPRGWQRFRRWTQREPALAARLAALSMFYGIECFTYYVLGVANREFHWQVSLIALVWVLASIGFQYLLRWRLRPAELDNTRPAQQPETARHAAAADGRVGTTPPPDSALRSNHSITTRRWFQATTRAAPFAWATLDAVLLLCTLWLRGGLTSHILMGFPLLIVLSGLWVDRRLVWYMTGLSLVGYLALVIDFYFLRPELQEGFDPSPMRHVYFVVGLLVVAGVVSHQVSRMRALSRYYQRWRQP